MAPFSFTAHKRWTFRSTRTVIAFHKVSVSLTDTTRSLSFCNCKEHANRQNYCTVAPMNRLLTLPKFLNLRACSTLTSKLFALSSRAIPTASNREYISTTLQKCSNRIKPGKKRSYRRATHLKVSRSTTGTPETPLLSKISRQSVKGVSGNT